MSLIQWKPSGVTPPPSDYHAALEPCRFVLRLDGRLLKPHATVSGVAMCTDLRWFLATGSLPVYARGRTATKLVEPGGEELYFGAKR